MSRSFKTYHDRGRPRANHGGSFYDNGNRSSRHNGYHYRNEEGSSFKPRYNHNPRDYANPRKVYSRGEGWDENMKHEVRYGRGSQTQKADSSKSKPVSKSDEKSSTIAIKESEKQFVQKNERTPKRAPKDGKREGPPAPKKAKRSNDLDVNETDSEEEGETDDDVKDQIIKELQLKLLHQQKQITENKMLKKKAETKIKTLKMLDVLGTKNKVLEIEKEELRVDKEKLAEVVVDLETKVKALKEQKGEIKTSVEAKKDVSDIEKIKKTLARVRNEREKQVDANLNLEKELINKSNVAEGLDGRVKDLKNELVHKGVELEKANKKIELLRKIRKSLENENNELKSMLEERYPDDKNNDEERKEEDGSNIDEVEKDKEEVKTADDEMNYKAGENDANEFDSDNEDIDGKPTSNLDTGGKKTNDEVVGNNDLYKESNEFDSENEEDSEKHAVGRTTFSESESETFIDSSNDELDAENEDVVEEEEENEEEIDGKEGVVTERNTNLDNDLLETENQTDMNVEDIDDEEIYLDTDDEFDEQFQVDRIVVNNYYNSPETIIDYSKIPSNLFKPGSSFQAKPTSLSNKLTFIACNNYIGRHQPIEEGRKSFCGLSPVCKFSWKPKKEITQVHILECDNHPKVGRVVWACRHHALASMKGVVLQSQRYNIRNKVIEQTLDIEAGNDIDEMSDGLEEGAKLDTEKVVVEKQEKVTGRGEESVGKVPPMSIDEDLVGTSPKLKKRLSLNKTKKKVRGTVAEVEKLEKKFGEGKK